MGYSMSHVCASLVESGLYNRHLTSVSLNRDTMASVLFRVEGKNACTLVSPLPGGELIGPTYCIADFDGCEHNDEISNVTKADIGKCRCYVWVGPAELLL